MRGQLKSFTRFAIFFPYLCSLIYASGMGMWNLVDPYVHLFVLIVLICTYLLIASALDRTTQQEFLEYPKRSIRVIGFLLTSVAVLFAAVNIYRVFGSFNLVYILKTEYFTNSLRAIEYRFGGSPVINNLHMLVALALPINIILFLQSNWLFKLLYGPVSLILFLLTVMIPIKTMMVESFLIAFLFVSITGDQRTRRVFLFMAPVGIALIMGIDVLRILTISNDHSSGAVLSAINQSVMNLSFYFAAGHLNFNLVVQELGAGGNWTMGYRLFAPLFDVILGLFGVGRLIERGYTGATLIDNVYLPEISEGVNIYTSMLSFYMDFGFLFVFIVPIFWLALVYGVHRFLLAIPSSAVLTIPIFYSTVVMSFGWSLKIFYMRFVFWVFVAALLFELVGYLSFRFAKDKVIRNR